MVTKSSSFLVLFLTTLGMITSIILPLNAQENIEYQAGTVTTTTATTKPIPIQYPRLSNIHKIHGYVQ